MPVSSPVTQVLLPSKYSLWATFCLWLPHTCSQERQFTAIDCTPQGDTQVAPPSPVRTSSTDTTHRAKGLGREARLLQGHTCTHAIQRPYTMTGHSPAVAFCARYPHASPENWATVFYCLSLKEKDFSPDCSPVSGALHSVLGGGTLPRGREGDVFIYLFITIAQLAYLFYHRV